MGKRPSGGERSAKTPPTSGTQRPVHRALVSRRILPGGGEGAWDTLLWRWLYSLLSLVAVVQGDVDVAPVVVFVAVVVVVVSGCR